MQMHYTIEAKSINLMNIYVFDIDQRINGKFQITF